VKVARQLCEGLRGDGELDADEREIDALAANIVVVASYWLSYEYVLNPRHYTEQQAMADALTRGCYQVLSLIGPYLRGETYALFKKLAEEYTKRFQPTSAT
jgi:hypothetical protein